MNCGLALMTATGWACCSAPVTAKASMAVHALAEIGDPAALPALRTVAVGRDDPRLQVAACYAICRIVAR